MRTLALLAAFWLAVLFASAAGWLGNFAIYHDWLAATAVSLGICAAGVLVGVMTVWIHGPR